MSAADGIDHLIDKGVSGSLGLIAPSHRFCAGAIKVRWAEIDAPELRQPFGQRSKVSLSELCFQEIAKLELVAKGSVWQVGRQGQMPRNGRWGGSSRSRHGMGV